MIEVLDWPIAKRRIARGVVLHYDQSSALNKLGCVKFFIRT